jgi:hypothetical protein
VHARVASLTPPTLRAPSSTDSMICAFVTPLQLQIKVVSGMVSAGGGTTAGARNNRSARFSGMTDDSPNSLRSDGTIAPSPSTIAPASRLFRTTSFL